MARTTKIPADARRVCVVSAVNGVRIRRIPKGAPRIVQVRPQ